MDGRILLICLRWLAIAAVSALSAGCASAPPDRTAAAHAAAPLGSRAAQIALEQVGQPYRYGGADPGGFDCSGLVFYAYRRVGQSLPRTTGELWDYTNPVARHELEPGDLLFFSIAGKMQHVGLYLGNGRFVHAPSSGRTVTVATLRSEFYDDAFLRAGRP